VVAGTGVMMPPLIKDWPLTMTVTIAELVANLQEYPQDMAVAFTVEGQVTPVVLERMKIMQETSSVYGPVLLMDAET
jgi:hypothetical protein